MDLTLFLKRPITTGYIDFAQPHNGRRLTVTGNGSLPSDSSLGRPFCWQICLNRIASDISKASPIFIGERGGHCCEEYQASKGRIERAHEVTCFVPVESLLGTTRCFLYERVGACLIQAASKRRASLDRCYMPNQAAYSHL